MSLAEYQATRVPLNWLCRIGLHPWERWTVIEAHAVTRVGDAQEIGRVVLQQRECHDCGLVRQTSNTIFYI